MLFHRKVKFIGRREDLVLKMLNQHFDLVTNIIKDLESLIASIAEHDVMQSIIEAKTGAISDYESLADDVHLKALIEISKGAFFSGLREDFMELFEFLDDIADYAKDCADILNRSRLTFPFIKKFWSDSDSSLHLLLNKIVSSANTLKKAVDNLQKDADFVIEESLKVRVVEEEADDLKSKIFRKAFSNLGEMNILSLIEFKEFLSMLYGMAKAAHHASEKLIVIVAKARS
ncbi:DUF47 family protein [Candidatus Bathyarchaeota archaeon]|nr:MAG: DUF47 family protein [Candidatus Bathyarchaeota archaeon]